MMNKNILYSTRVGIFLIVLMLAGTGIGRSFAQEETQSFVLVEGKGQIEVPVEYLELRFNISRSEKTAVDATAYTGELLETVFADLKSQYNIDDNELYTQDVGLHAEYEYDNNAAGGRQRKLVGFRSRINVVLKLYEYGNYADIINTIVVLGVEGIDSLNYVPSQDPKYYEEALLIAYDEAQQKADALIERFEGGVYVQYRQITEMTNSHMPYLQEAKLLGSDSTGQNMGVRSTYGIEATVRMKLYLAK